MIRSARRRSSYILAIATAMLLAMLAARVANGQQEHRLTVRDITSIEGVRENQLVGYGIVTGLRGTGDSQQTFFTVQTLANTLQRMGVQITPAVVTVKNVAAVFVTASLPPFSRPGMDLDVTVSSVGDAKSLSGGVLLLTALRAADGKVYAVAQGSLVLGGYTEGNSKNSKTVNHPTTGRISNGATVERDASIDLTKLPKLSFLLLNPDFTTARNVETSINKEFGKPVARAIDSRRVEVNVADTGDGSVPDLISRVQSMKIDVEEPAHVVVNERTGTIVMGGDVRLQPVSVIHGSLTIDVETTPIISQPAPFSNGTTTATTQTKLNVTDTPAQSIQLKAGASVEELIKGLHAIGATSHDIIAILQAIKAAGGLDANLEVI
ncbi:flagellar basal body P-ring protein FlgI [Bryocella elongata]|nr:flagellar basal body P-ring protein FlgI [Bryocella elongata]